MNKELILIMQLIDKLEGTNITLCNAYHRDRLLQALPTLCHGVVCENCPLNDNKILTSTYVPSILNILKG